MKAAKMAPQAVLLPIDMEEYRRYSRQFKAAVRAITPLVEDRGVDEIYIDLTEAVGAQADPWPRAREVACQLKEAVHAATGLSCSIGVTPNKLLSKIASDLDKPNGVTVLRHDDVPLRIWPLPASRAWSTAGGRSSGSRRSSSWPARAPALGRRDRALR